MPKLADVAHKIRSKNAGPFWITIDIFCPDRPSFDIVCRGLSLSGMATLLGVPQHQLYRYDIGDLNVVKFSMHRTHIQGSRYDRDMHGAQMALLCADIELEGAKTAITTTSKMSPT